MLEPVRRYLPIMPSLFVTLLYHCKRICHQSLCKAALFRSSILSRLEVGVDQKRRGNNKTPEKIQQKTSPPQKTGQPTGQPFHGAIQNYTCDVRTFCLPSSGRRPPSTRRSLGPPPCLSQQEGQASRAKHSSYGLDPPTTCH